MPALRNPRQERFAELIVTGNSPADAYVIAGYGSRAAYTCGPRLLKSPAVAARIAELRNDVSQLEIVRYAATREDVLARLDELSRGAQAAGAWSAAVRAEELKGRELGMFAPRPEPKLPWDGDFRKLDDMQLQNLMASLEAKLDRAALPEIPDETESAA